VFPVCCCESFADRFVRFSTELGSMLSRRSLTLPWNEEQTLSVRVSMSRGVDCGLASWAVLVRLAAFCSMSGARSLRTFSGVSRSRTSPSSIEELRSGVALRELLVSSMSMSFE